jgi:Mn2+/Fe2+ NRAMP family transporter
MPIQSLIQAMLISQTFNGILLPVILITMLVLINDKRLMGKFSNGRIFNILAWATAVALILLAMILVVVTFIA